MNTAHKLHLVETSPQTIHAAAVQVGLEQLKVIYQQFKDSPNLHMEWDLDEVQHLHSFELIQRAPEGSTTCDWVKVYSSGQIMLEDSSAIEQLQEVISEANGLLGQSVLPFMQQPVDFATLGNPISRYVAIPPVVQTYSGHMFNLLVPEQSLVDIADIAHALSNICRFNGHVTQFYSVAQHSVLVSKLVPPYLALPALLHDAAEAYLGDCATPFKQLLSEYKTIENRIMQHICNTIGLDYPLHSEIKRADIRALSTEVRDLMNPPTQPEYWNNLRGISPSAVRVTPLPPKQAEELFLQRYFELQTLSVA